jgi:RpiB/LacA/LacB family sugar-phosphate isomerase
MFFKYMKRDRLIIIGADHAGFSKKEKLKDYLIREGYEVYDVGAKTLKNDDDYPDFAFKVGEKIVAEKGRGILICGSGAGVCIGANKVKGVRAVHGADSYVAKKSREDNESNVLCLSGRRQSFEKIKRIVNVWLETDFSGEKRHKRRLLKIDRYEKR